MSREKKMLMPLCVLLMFMLTGLVKPTGEELAGLGVFLIGYTALYRAVMSR